MRSADPPSANHPGETAGRCLGKNGSQPGDEILAIEIITEDLPALQAAADDVVKGARGVYAGLSGHAGDYATDPTATHNRMGVPLYPAGDGWIQIASAPP